MDTRHGGQTIALHWLAAVLIGLLWLSAQFIDAFPRGPLRWNMVGTHMLMGVVLILLMIYRVGWRWSRHRSRPAMTRSRLASAVHIALYLLVFASLGFGLWNAWARGEHVFNLFQIPAFDEGNKALRKWAGSQHKLFVNMLLIAAGGHALIALVHQFVFRDGVLQRMLPQRLFPTKKDQLP